MTVEAISGVEIADGINSLCDNLTIAVDSNQVFTACSLFDILDWDRFVLLIGENWVASFPIAITPHLDREVLTSIKDHGEPLLALSVLPKNKDAPLAAIAVCDYMKARTLRPRDFISWSNRREVITPSGEVIGKYFSYGSTGGGNAYIQAPDARKLAVVRLWAHSFSSSLGFPKRMREVIHPLEEEEVA